MKPQTLPGFYFHDYYFFAIKDLNLLKEKNQINFIAFCLPIYYDVVVVQYSVLQIYIGRKTQKFDRIFCYLLLS